MNRVTLINLAGRAFYVEDNGVEAIDRWLEAARATLEGDPDCDELLVDFEQAIADRCAAQRGGDTDVVTTAAVDEMLSALGPVEPTGSLDGEAGLSAARSTTWRSHVEVDHYPVHRWVVRITLPLRPKLSPMNALPVQILRKRPPPALTAVPMPASNA